MHRSFKPSNAGIALILAVLTAILLIATAPNIGVTWDEPAYIASAKSIAGWFGLVITNPTEMFDSGTIVRYWTTNHEHPPVEKILSAITWVATRHIFGDLTALRLGNILLVALLVGLVYLLVSGTYGKPAGAFAALALMSMPRFFFHSHLAALDIPVAVGIFALTFLFWKTIDRREWWWGIVLGIAWGIVVATKLNGVFVPIAFGIWLLVFRRKWSSVLRLFLMGGFAILTFFLVWPWMYYHTWTRAVAYVNFHLDHIKIGQWYFGHFYLPPPWQFVLVMIGVVVPLTILLLTLVGAARAGTGKRDKGLTWLMIISAFVSISPFLFGKSLLYDNDRLFMPVYPFLACLAGIGFGGLIALLRRLAERMKHPRLVLPMGLLLSAALLAPQSVAMAGQYPHLLSYYNEVVGGLPGATHLGLETTYWCETYASALPFINLHAMPGDKIWVEPWSYDVLIYYQTIGRLRKDVFILNPMSVMSVLGPLAPSPIAGNFQDANWYIVQFRQGQAGQGGLDNSPIHTLFSRSPVFEVSYQGIPLMRLYQGLK